MPPAGFEPAFGERNLAEPLSASEGRNAIDEYRLPPAIRLKMEQLSARPEADKAKAAVRKSHKKKRP
jgi:hypothetical protein